MLEIFANVPGTHGTSSWPRSRPFQLRTIPYNCTQSGDLVKLVTIGYCGEGTHIFDNGWQGRKDLLLTSGRDSSREGKGALNGAVRWA